MRRVVVTVATVLAMSAGLLGFSPPATVPAAQAAASPSLECDEGLIEKALANGAAWRMCARIHTIKGLVLEKIEFKPATGDREYSGYKRILDQVYLAQLNVPYDTGAVSYNDIPDFGFGGRFLVEQIPDLCASTTLDVDQAFMLNGQLVERKMPGICVDEVGTGLSSHSQEVEVGEGPRFVDRGTALEVSSVSKVGWYEYQQKVTFSDVGQIDVGLGATGDLAPAREFYSTDPGLGWPLGPPVDGIQQHGASHRHNAIYRVDFGIDEGSRQVVEQWDYESTGVAADPIVHGKGTERTEAFWSVPGVDHDDKTWWRVLNPDSLNKDGHPRSYEIVNHNATDKYSPVTSPLVSFTNDVDCQEYAANNQHPDCRDQTILDYVEGDDAPLTDPVAWVNVGFHHIDRDEDQSPMPVHWQSFQLVPRDFFAQNPSTPAARQCINGFESGIDSTYRPCIATNRLKPTIDTEDDPIGPGAALKANPGSWYINRTQWNYSYLWFRDGQPIVNLDADGAEQPAVGREYVVTGADQGASLTVKVTASQTGFGSGTAESAAVKVPGRPKTEPSMRVTVSRGQYGVGGTALVDLGSATGTASVDVGGRPLGRKNLVAGRVKFDLGRSTLPGRWPVRVSYQGSSVHLPAQIVTTYVVSKGKASKPTLKFSKKPTLKKTGKATATVKTSSGLVKASGQVTITLTGKTSKKTVKATVKNGKVSVKLPRLKKGTYKVTVVYNGSSTYLSSKSKTYLLAVK